MAKQFVGILGSGAREHAIAWRLEQDFKAADQLHRFVFYPGNDFLKRLGTCVDSFDELIRLGSAHEGPRLIIVGSEIYAGVADQLRADPHENSQWRVWGPSAQAAQLEWSKIFSKQWMQRYKIPTAHCVACTENEAQVLEALEAYGKPLVMKYDGLLGGKGVAIVEGKQAATKFYNGVALMAGRKFSGKFVLEEKLIGIERSLFLFIDKSGHVHPSPLSMDFKAKYDGNSGPNTGGMGAFTPAPLSNNILPDNIRAHQTPTKQTLSKKGLDHTKQWDEFLRSILCPAIEKGLKDSNLIYAGVLYVGLMFTAQGPKVLEFNVRLGDPETQTFLPFLKTSFADVVLQSTRGQLEIPIQGKENTVFGGIVCATKGYGEQSAHGGDETDILDPAWLSDPPYLVFFAGLKKQNESYTVHTGRVATVVYTFDRTDDPDTVLAKEKAALEWIKTHGWRSLHIRTDLARQYVEQM